MSNNLVQLRRGGNTSNRKARLTHLERHLRNLGVGRRELAGAVGVSERTVGNWLAGRFEAKIVILPKIADFLRKRGAPPDLEAAELFLEWQNHD